MHSGQALIEAPAARAGASAVPMVAAALATAVAVAVFVDGGFGITSRALFAATAGAALLLAVLAEPDRALRAARTLPVLALGALALATAISAAWTVGEPVKALRWSVVIAGYGALAVAAATIAANRAGINALAATIAGTAVIAGLAGLAGIAFRSQPLALHMGGEWQAAGPFEYQPALAWLEVAAMPILLAAMVRARRPLAGLAAAGLAIATMATLLSSTRLGLAMIAITVGLTLVVPAPVLGSRRALAYAWALAAGLPLAVLLATDPGDPASAIASDAARTVLLASIVAVAAGGWAWLQPLIARRRSVASASPPRPLALGAGAGALVALAVGIGASTQRSGPGVEPSSGLTHGRLDHWEAATRTAVENPVLGVGGDAYLRGSHSDQGDDPVLYAHDLPLELAAELGLVGLAAGVALYFGAGRAAWRARRDPRIWLLAPVALSFLAVNLVDWSWHLAGAGAVWAIGLGGLLAKLE